MVSEVISKRILKKNFFFYISEWNHRLVPEMPYIAADKVKKTIVRGDNRVIEMCFHCK